MNNSDIVKVKIDNKDYDVKKGTTIISFLKNINYSSKYPVLLAKCNNTIRELNFPIITNTEVIPIDLTSEIGNRSMVSGLIFMIMVVIKTHYGKQAEFTVDHAIGKSLYIETRFEITEDTVNTIKEEMIKLVENKRPIEKITVDRIDAIKYYKAVKATSKEEILKYNTDTYVSLYKLNGFYDYYYMQMPINTKVLDKFDLTYVDNHSFILSYPTVFLPDEIPKYTEHPNMAKVFSDFRNWAKLMKLENTSDLNRIVSSGDVDDLIRICENKMNAEFLEVAKSILSNNKRKVVLMAGPSSSGKTTSSNKICLALKTLGKNPKVLSMDDYFVDNEETPLDEFGNKDYECLEAVDLKLLDTQIKDLLAGKTVKIPTYDFINGKKEYHKELKIDSDDIIIIEGIHALDSKILANVTGDFVYKIYVSPLIELNIDGHNRISTTDNRLLRRIVRDSRTRGHDVSDTIAGWKRVRNGEEKYIFPFQDNADYTLNTALHYEIGVLKTYVEPLLYSVQPDSPYYNEAIRLIKFLRNFLPITADAIPKDSVLREFIGGSCYLD